MHGLDPRPDPGLRTVGIAGQATSSSRGAFVSCALAAAATLVVVVPIVRRMSGKGDFPAHGEFARQIVETGGLPVPHFAYHLFLVAVHAVLPSGDWRQAAIVVTAGGLAVTAALLARWTREALPGRDGVQLAMAVVLPPLLLLVQPVLPFGPMPRNQWLIGFFPPNQWHNPTTLLSKPFALGLFGMGLLAAFGGERASGRRIAAAAALVVGSGLTKPSFLMAFLPAVGLAALVNARRADWRLLIAGLAVPAVVLLALQYLLRYRVQAELGVSVMWAPLYVVGLYVPTDFFSLATRLLASLLFPLTVTLVFWPTALRDRRMWLAWATFASGATYGYLLAEGGGKADAGDFLWSGQLGAFLLFAVSAVFVVRACASQRWSRGLVVRLVPVCLVLGWHLVSGVRHLQTSWLD